jgi:hypothetical protein
MQTMVPAIYATLRVVGLAAFFLFFAWLIAIGFVKSDDVSLVTGLLAGAWTIAVLVQRMPACPGSEE